MSEAPLRTTDFVSFDGMVAIRTAHRRPDRHRQLECMQGTQSVRGGGYAYSAASFRVDTPVLEMSCFDRLLAFDQENALVRVEAGARLIDVMAWALERGLQLPVVPGYPLITIGGCIAADVHGKNPWRDGTFADWTDAITLFHPDRGYRTLRRQIDPDFALTCGGFGLTGVIVDATLRLVPLLGRTIAMTSRPLGSLGEAVQALAECAGDMAYSWHDACPGRHFGRGLLTTGHVLAQAGPTPPFHFRPIDARSRGALPFALWNRSTIRLANAANYWLGARIAPSRHCDTLEASFPLARRRMYLSNFGRPGFREVQILVSQDHVVDFLASLDRLLQRPGAPATMASLKRFRGQQRGLSQTGEGYLIALDFLPGPATDRALKDIDGLMLETTAQPNLSKDSRLDAATARRSVACYQTFAQRLAEYDPQRRFRTELSDRIGL